HQVAWYTRSCRSWKPRCARGNVGAFNWWSETLSSEQASRERPGSPPRGHSGERKWSTTRMLKKAYQPLPKTPHPRPLPERGEGVQTAMPPIPERGEGVPPTCLSPSGERLKGSSSQLGERHGRPGLPLPAQPARGEAEKRLPLPA